MEEFIKMIKEEMDLLDNEDSIEGQELRKELGIEGLEGKELLKYKIHFLAKHLGHGNLHCMEKSDYFQELIKDTIDIKEAQELFDLTKITCVENDASMKILWVITDKEDGSKIIYSVSDEEEIVQETQNDIKKQFEYGMRILSKSREIELKEVLLGKSKQFRVFEEEEIDEGTKSVPIGKKEDAKTRVTNDQIKNQQKDDVKRN